jgi:hypothetical protein
LKVLVDTGLMMVMVAVPVYVEEVLATGAENTVYIAIPGAAGLALGMVVAPAALTFINERAVALGGFILFAGSIVMLPFVDHLAREIPKEWQATLRLSAPILLISVLLPAGGLGIGLTQIAARTAVYRRTGSGLISQVLATQSAVGSIAALVPIVLSGILLDLAPVDLVLLLIAAGLCGPAVLGYKMTVRRKLSLHPREL